MNSAKGATGLIPPQLPKGDGQFLIIPTEKIKFLLFRPFPYLFVVVGNDLSDILSAKA